MVRVPKAGGVWTLLNLRHFAGKPPESPERRGQGQAFRGANVMRSTLRIDKNKKTNNDFCNHNIHFS